MAGVQRKDMILVLKGVLLIPGLSAEERRVLTVIIDHYNWKTGECFPSVERISKLLGINEATVRRATSALSADERNILEKVSHGGRHHCAMYKPGFAVLVQAARDFDRRMKGENAEAQDDHSASEADIDASSNRAKWHDKPIEGT